MAFREDPHFKGKARGKRGDAEELVIFRHDAIAVREVLPENIAIDAAFFLLIMSPAALDLSEDAGGDDRQGDELWSGCAPAWRRLTRRGS